MLEESAFAALVDAGQGVFTSAEAHAHGITRSSIRWAHERGVLHRLLPGVFTSTADWEAADGRARHLLRLRAAQRINPRAVACGASAAILYGLPIPGDPGTTEPQLTSPARSGRRAGSRYVREKGVPPGRYLGVQVISPAYTVLDCARIFDRPWGLAVADAAVFAGLVTVEELRRTLADSPQRGAAKVHWVVAHTRPKVESPLESLGRAAIILAGLPEPEPQKWVRTRGGWYRVDMLDETNRVVTEADGKVKYDGPQAVWQEKSREDDIRDCRLEVVRFTMADHFHQPPWLAGYRRALGRGARLA